MSQMILFGARLREERERLGLTQDALGVTPQAQRKYEKGERAPDAAYLIKFADAGADILYLLTGERSASRLSGEESALVTGYRSMDVRGKAAALAMVAGYIHQSGPALTINGSSIGQVVQGDAAGGGTVTPPPTEKKRR